MDRMNNKFYNSKIGKDLITEDRLGSGGGAAGSHNMPDVEAIFGRNYANDARRDYVEDL